MNRHTRIAVAMYRRREHRRWGTDTCVDADGVRWFYIADFKAEMAAIREKLPALLAADMQRAYRTVDWFLRQGKA